jgi:hypothetical protein
MPSSSNPTPPDTFAPVPILDPAAFERFEGWRETSLAVITDAKANSALRAMAELVYTICLEYSRYWPKEPEGSFFHQCRAAVADLRHMQGYLVMLEEVSASASLTEPRSTPPRFAGGCLPG